MNVKRSGSRRAKEAEPAESHLFNGATPKMQVSDEMVRQAMKKVIEAGLLPRDALTTDTMRSHALVREILQGALDEASRQSNQSS